MFAWARRISPWGYDRIVGALANLGHDDDLLGCPLGRRTPRNFDVEDLSIGKSDHEEDMERLE